MKAATILLIASLWMGGAEEEEAKFFHHRDRGGVTKSKRMIAVYLRHYATDGRLGHLPTVIDMARIHKGGPNGFKKKATVKYGEKFKRLYYGQN